MILFLFPNIEQKDASNCATHKRSTTGTEECKSCHLFRARSRTPATCVMSRAFEDEVCDHALCSVGEGAQRGTLWPWPSPHSTRGLVLCWVLGTTTCKAFGAFNFVCLLQETLDPFSYSKLTYLCGRAVRTSDVTALVPPESRLENLRWCSILRFFFPPLCNFSQYPVL